MAQGIGYEYGTFPLPEIRAGKTGNLETFTEGSNKATGTWTFAGQPSPADTMTVNGTVFTFVASGATGNQINISGVNLAGTLTNIVTVLNASVVAGVAVATYSDDGATVVTATYDTVGTAGNAYTLAASVATVSGATMTGGRDAPAISVATEPTKLALTQAVDQGFTLADGEEGQKKLIYCTLGSTGNGVVTPANLSGGTIITFSTTRFFAELRFMSGSWQLASGDAVVS